MFSTRTRYIAVKATIRYKKDGILAKSVFFDANNLRLLASLLNSNRYCNSHTNHGVFCADETHHLYALEYLNISEVVKRLCFQAHFNVKSFRRTHHFKFC